MKTGQITIKDIARKLNVSTSTVSRALRGMPEVSKETRNAVLELANLLDYEPNPIALSLVKKKTKTIGVIIPNILDNLFANVIKGVQKVALNSGYNIIITQSHESLEEETRCIKNLVSNRVDGMLIAFSSETSNADHLERIIASKIPVVQFDRVLETFDSSFIKVNDYEGAKMVVDHLFQIGCKRLAFIGGPQNLDTFKSRFLGYMDGMRMHNLPIDEALILFTGFKIENGVEMAKHLFNAAIPPDAICTNSDSLALGALKFLHDSTRDVSTVAVTGFSNEKFSGYTNPSITTVDQRAVEMGETAMRMLLTQILIDPTAYQPEKVNIKTELIVRESTLRFKTVIAG